MSGQVFGLTRADLESYPGNDRPGRSGDRLRYYCPIHGGDKQKSFELRPNGGFKCFACGAWGFLEEAREEWKAAQKQNGERKNRPRWLDRLARPVRRDPVEPPAEDLADKLARFKAALQPGSIAARYLEWRGISLETAKKYELGYAANGEWPHIKDGRPVRQWKYGRLVIPHTDPKGNIINLYGRAIGGDDVPKADRHTHLPGPRGVFNAAALAAESVIITEGPFDALALIEAGYPNACAIFGVNGLRFEWLKARIVIFAMDQDAAGAEWRQLAAMVKLMGKEVYWIEPEAYAGCKDLAEAWQKYRILNIGDIPTARRDPVETAQDLFEGLAIVEAAAGLDEPPAEEYEPYEPYIHEESEQEENEQREADRLEYHQLEEEMKKAGWLILSPGAAYEYRLTDNHSLFIWEENGSWTVWRATWYQKEQPAKEKTLAEYVGFAEAVRIANDYIQWFKGGKGRKRSA